MTTQHIETLIIGAGQAGLSTGYHLQQRERRRGVLAVAEGFEPYSTT
jgi:cation diffusion facilitator CzcD-associated flavoprotein CzcO